MLFVGLSVWDYVIIRFRDLAEILHTDGDLSRAPSPQRCREAAENVVFLGRQPLSFISFVRWRLLLATRPHNVKHLFHIRSLEGSTTA